MGGTLTDATLSYHYFIKSVAGMFDVHTPSPLPEFSNTPAATGTHIPPPSDSRPICPLAPSCLELRLLSRESASQGRQRARESTIISAAAPSRGTNLHSLCFQNGCGAQNFAAR